MAIIEVPETIVKSEETELPARAIEIVAQGGDAETVNDGGIKREREEEPIEEQGPEKKANKEDNSFSEQSKVTLGHKSFRSSKEMFDYFCKFLHAWPPNLDVNKVIKHYVYCFSRL